MARIEIDPNYSAPTFSRATAAADLFKKEDVQNLAAAMSAHTHAAGKGLPVSGIAAGTITSDMIADGTISGSDIAINTITGSNIAAGTIVGANLANDSVGAQQIAPGAVGASELAPGAISQSFIASGVSGGPTTTSSVMVDCPDMAVTINGQGGDVLVWFIITLQHASAGAYAGINIALDGVDSSVPIAGSVPAANGLWTLVNVLRLTNVTGTRLIKGRWAALSGGTLIGNSTARLLMVQETRR